MQISWKHALLAGSLSGLLATAPLAVSQTADTSIQQSVQRALHDKRYDGVHSSVQGGVVTLSGTVETVRDKDDAAKKASKQKDVTSVNDQIQITAPADVDEQKLYTKLARGLATDRIGYGTTTFNSLTLTLQKGVATLGGVVYGPVDKESALELVKSTPGVRQVIDKIQVAPPSPMDDRIRRAEERTLYGYGPFLKYAQVPSRPIRIIVLNGHVTLTGVVDSKGDKDLAGLRANTVPGVFSVTNNLQYSGEPESH